MTANYTDILSMSWGDIPAPKLLPSGHWVLKGRNAAFIKGEGETNSRVVFFYTPKEPMEDVDAGSLNALGENYDVAENDVSKTIWIERNKDWDKVRNHLATHGVDVSPEVPLPQSLKDFRGTEVVAYIDQRQFTRKDGEAAEENTASAFEPLK